MPQTSDPPNPFARESPWPQLPQRPISLSRGLRPVRPPADPPAPRGPVPAPRRETSIFTGSATPLPRRAAVASTPNGNAVDAPETTAPPASIAAAPAEIAAPIEDARPLAFPIERQRRPTQRGRPLVPLAAWGLLGVIGLGAVALVVLSREPPVAPPAPHGLAAAAPANHPVARSLSIVAAPQPVPPAEAPPATRLRRASPQPPAATLADVPAATAEVTPSAAPIDVAPPPLAVPPPAPEPAPPPFVARPPPDPNAPISTHTPD